MQLSSLMFPLLLVLVAVPLFLSARKQKRAMQDMQQMQNSLGPGDRVMTTSGLYGTVVETGEDTIDLEIAPGMVTTWVRAAVREKVNPTVDEDTEEETLSAEADDDTTALDTDTDSAGTPQSTAQLAEPLEHSKKK
ncbi:preprotein translocase subunit YajC [Goodfellowiella coeruleoviolacea]|uniref:Preprotein translocase subunit YajC n=1 Tax=Goodfellowiella coeruleoviolacea TaxID=334858 RepID=A0AAE3KH98_9PSEU|nr:preprotein translocase subunit YajC [Goodfellowiella coeruleoviolacea]MCP2166627.1 preprotein translocase subunit YajC [Goodfellowiella coeruleoviolacea]